MPLNNDQWQEALVQLANSGLAVTNANVNGQAFKVASAPVVLSSDQWSASTPDIVEQNIQNWIRTGQGYMATTGQLITATNANLTVGGLSIFNNSTAKNIYIYSLILLIQSGSTCKVYATTADPAFGNVITPQNASLGGAASAIATTVSSSASNVTASVTPIGTQILFGGWSSFVPTELLTNGAGILLPANTAHGVALYPFIGTAGNVFGVSAKWIEY